MANGFSKEEVVAFGELCRGFEDALVFSRRVKKYQNEGRMMERAGDVIWRPMPYIMNAYDGLDQSANFNGVEQLSVPAQIGDVKSVPWFMSAKNLRDDMQRDRIAEGAFQQLASTVNLGILTKASHYGSIVSKRTTAATGFTDVADCDTRMNRIGVPMMNRTAAYSSANYNNMAANLAARETMNGKVSRAYAESYVGRVSSFETFKMDYGVRLAAAGGSSVTINGANQYHVPAATQTAATGERSNVDNRFQLLTITVGSGTVAVGDAFTIAGVNEVHHITKADTGELKTFRIVDIVSGAGGSGVVKITPAICSNGGGTRPEIQYQNVSATPADGAAITFLNTAAADVNPFWYEDAIEILPGNLEVEQGAGLYSLRATLDNGVPVLMTKQSEINSLQSKYRVDVFLGYNVKNTEMCGMQLFSQS